MCGRKVQASQSGIYTNGFGGVRILEEYEPDYNCCPGVKHWAIRRTEKGLEAENILWGWLSPWAKKEGLKPAINAKLEKLLGGYYRSLMTHGRIVIPADGWYEWTKEGTAKQPWYIYRTDNQPLYLAALTNRIAGAEQTDAGYVLVTNESAGGMVDIHDRRPVVLTANDARDWIDLGFSYKVAEAIARECALPVDQFAWHKVSNRVNGYREHGADLIAPVTAI
jgi:putative SOS response-associated peptidase YedK